MRCKLEYWKDGDWFVGRLPQIPGVFSQGATLAELEENIRDAYQIMTHDCGASLSLASAVFDSSRGA